MRKGPARQTVFNWMGGDATWWHSGTPLDESGDAGRRPRRAILSGTLTDLESTGIYRSASNRSFRESALRRVDGTRRGLYTHVLVEVMYDDHEWTWQTAATIITDQEGHGASRGSAAGQLI